MRSPRDWIVATILAGAVVLLFMRHDGMIGPLSDVEFGQAAGALALHVFLGLGARALVFRTASEATRNAVAWVAILGLLLAGYAYRDEVQDVGHRISLGLIPGSAVTRLADDGTVRVQIGRDRGGHFSVEGSVEGVPVRFLVDTGATTIALTARDARRIGFTEGELRYTQPIMTANGRAFAAPVTLGSVSIGGIERRGVAASVAAPGALSQSLLGMNFVGSLASFEIRGDRLILAD